MKKHLRKPFSCSSADNLPFPDNTFDAIWTITVLEHVPEIEKALNETLRVLKPGGIAYLAPAWHCRSWAAEGYEVRPYSDFNLLGKFIKLSIPFRNNIFVRAVPSIIFRSFREINLFFAQEKPLKFYYRKLKANYEIFYCSDSDACNSMDPHEMILWFKSRGHHILSHETFIKRFLVRHEAIIARKRT